MEPNKLSDTEIKEILPDHIEFISKIGTGGFMVVIACRNRELSDEVLALKTPAPRHYLLQELAQRGITIDTLATREAQLRPISENNTYIPAIKWIEKRDGRIFVFQEYVEGSRLDYFLRAQINQKQKKAVIRDLLRGIGTLHKKRVVHCDLKFDNIIVQEGNKVKILDLSNYTFQGNPLFFKIPSLYRAPETYGKNYRAHPTADIWATGVLLYKMLTNEWPIEGDFPQWDTLADIALAEERIRVEERAKYKQPIQPAELSDDISFAENQIIMKALSKDPNHRYQNAQRMSRAWNAAQRRNKVYFCATGIIAGATYIAHHPEIISFLTDI